MITSSDKPDYISLIKAWEASGESQKGFCRSRGINFANFQYHLARYRKSLRRDTGSGFIPLQVRGNDVPGTTVEIIYPNGTRLCFQGLVDPGYLRTLLA